MQTQVQLKPLNEVIHDRRATVDFSDAPVPDEVLRQVLDAGRKAPSGYNLQPWRFVIVRDAEQRKALRSAAFNLPKVEHAPVVIVACAALKAWQQGDLEESLRIAAEHGYD